MEILHKFKQNGYFTVDLYNLLEKKMLTDKDIMDEIIPSVYEKEMKMSTQERLQSLNSIEVSNIVTVGDKKPGKLVLAFTPKILIFQNYKPNDKIVTKFSIRNISNTPIHLNTLYKESSYFVVKPCLPQGLSRIAPGMSVSYTVTFLPIHYEDYTHKVVFQTDVDQYVLPLIAMGPRPLFNFPDEITVTKMPLKVQSAYNLSVCNIGMVPAGFTLKTKCPFSVHPKSAYLNPNQKIIIKVGFNSMHLGLAAGILNIMFETGEMFRVKLFGSTYTVSIELEKQVVRFSDTYNTLARQQTLKITNKSEFTLTYICMKNDSVFSDFDEKLKLATIFHDLKQSESGKYTKLVQYDVLSSDEHDRVYTRIFFDEVQALISDETLFFQNAHFRITPIKGKLWPNKATELTITFNPEEIGEFDAMTFFDIDGIPDRVPLRMTGASLPPSIHLNVETLDMDNIYINTTYHYEIVAINSGHINGVITYNETKSLFGSLISCTPAMYCLRPGDKEAFIISFCNSNQGPFFEEINFAVRDTNVVLKLYLKGTVIYPSVLFSVPCVDFGQISVGVPTVLELDIINESVVNIKGNLKISSDGPEISSYTLQDCEVADKLEPPKWPREFNIEPCKIEIQPESNITVKVTLTANLVRANQTYLEFELENSDSPPITLPVTFNALVPDITPAPDIKLRACFLDYPYKEDIIISSNGFSGYYFIEEQSEDETLRVEIKNTRGYIEPNSQIILPTTITTSDLGQHEYTVRMYLFGMTKPLEICHVYGLGVRPIVTCMPISCHWGQLKLLTRSQKILTLCNDSPVTVYFKAALLNRDGRWTVSPAEGLIEPESETELVLSLYLVDADTYTNKVVIHLEKVKDILVPLSATGTGTSIVVGENRDKILLGCHFTRIPLNCKITVENCGTRVHNLDWSEYYKPPKTKHLTPHFFSLEPRSFKLSAGEKMDLHITAVCNKVTTIKETWYLIGSVEGLNKKELLLECPVMAEFVEPKVEISATFLDFRFDSGPHSDYYHLTDILAIKNVSKLPLDIEINIRPPFAIIQKQTYKILPEDETTTCGCIYYDQADLNMKNMLKELGHQKSKHYIDYLTLKPVGPLRDRSLGFFEDINKIKAAFHLTHTVEEKLEDLEVMKIQLLFDTTKHLNMKSKIYCDIMKIKFKGHKNKDAVKLIGKVNFPNIFLASPKVDFRCILNGSIESKVIKIQNLTPLLVCYRFQWKKCCVIPVAVPEVQILDHGDQLAIKTSAEDTDIYINELPETVLDESHEASVEGVATAAGSGAIKGSHLTLSASADDLIDECTLMKTKHMKKIAPMLGCDFYEPFFPWIHKLPQLIKYKNININEVLQVTPHRGLLKPNEIQNVHIIFRPTHNISVQATLECEVLGGPSELIKVTGQSSDLMYQLNTHKLNFKIRSFHEQASENLILTNIAPLVFEYTTYLNEPVFETELDGTILETVPPQKQLEPDEEIEIKIVVRPGILGYFNRTFLLEIGHLPCMPVEVFGWGVIPQVYLSLKRPEMAKLPAELGYQAISTLTAEYLLAVIEIFKSGTPEHMNSPQLERCFEDPDLQEDWHICSAWDDYPTTMDIELAIERLLVIHHVRYRPDILTGYSGGKSGTIPGFYTTAYEINFGVVITGSQVQCVADVVNYGPMMTKLILAKYSKTPPWLTLKQCNKLNPGETGKMEVVFAPTPLHFPHLENTVETTLYFEVPYGVTIPVHIKGLCAVPYLTSNITELNLGSVQCGHKIVTSIPLKNVGKPTCIWYVTLRVKTAGPNPMTIVDSSGQYAPGQGGWLSIAFKPTMEMTYDALLIFRFHMNPNRLVIPVTGQGIMPHVHIIGPNMRFPPTLPWADTTEMYFGLTNPCPFPIEVIVAHCDDKWNEEDEVFQFLVKYYNKPEEMLVPAIKPGSGLPVEIINFYKKFRENVRKAKEEESTAAHKAASAKHSIPKKAKPSPRTRGRSTIPASTNTGSASAETPPKRFRTEAEIIADEIKTLREQGHDPLKECLRVFDNASSKSSADKHSKGIMIFLYGSPCEEMQSKELAYSLGKALDIPTVNIDNCIVDALRVCSGSTRQILMTSLNELHEAAMKLTMTKASSIIQDESTEHTSSQFEDEHEVIWKKIEFLSTTKYTGTPRSKVSDKKKSPSMTHTIVATSTLFPLDLIQYLLIDYFNTPKFSNGFVVDTLTSMVVKSPQTLLTTVLKCKPSIRNVHLVLCQMDFAKWAQIFDESQREAETLDEFSRPQSKVYNETEIEGIVNSLEEMDYEEFENASQDLKAIYRAYGLEARRQKYAQRTGWSPDSIKKGVRDTSKSVIPVVPSQSMKKMKKDDLKGKSTHPEYALMSNRYADYIKNVYDTILHVAANWIFEEGEMGYPLYTITGQLAGATQKKTKVKKSDLQLQLSAEVVITDRGFPVTLISSSCLKYKNALKNMFFNCPAVKEALKKEEIQDILECETITKQYTVLTGKTMPVIHHEEPLTWLFLEEPPIKKCECNQITDLNLLDDSTQDNVLNILSKWHCICGKKKTDSYVQVTSTQTSTIDMPSVSVEKVATEEEEEMLPLPLRSVKAVPVRRGRLVLNPGDLVRLKYTFKPTVEGNYSVKRFVEVSGWPDSRADITVSGICDLPRLDNRPKKMFANFVRRTFDDNVYKITYLDDSKLFQFGPIFVGSNRVYEEEYTIDLKNASLMTADIEIEFLEDTSIFEINKNFIQLEPGGRGKLTISAAPHMVGTHTSVLLFCIKDNPEIVEVTFTCTGVLPILEILPQSKFIEYGKFLLYRRADDRFIIKNDSILPIMWKIHNPEDFVDNFIIAQTSGIIQRYDNKVIPVTYIACNVGVVENQALTIDIYDELGRGAPLFVDTLFLSAECYDVLVECTYENAHENFLNYGNVKVNSTVYREIYLLNRGKYNIYYKLKKVKKFPESSLLKSFNATPDCGVLLPSMKLEMIEFECTPTTSMNLHNVPVYNCSLLDGNKDQVVVAKFPVCVTIASFYNTFTLFPLGELNFHIIPVGSGVMREVTLNNTSKCPFTYEIVLPQKYALSVEDQAAHISTPPSKEPPSKDKNTRIKIAPLKCGNFLIVNEDNLLAPGASRIIQIQFLATSAKTFEETINFVISDTCPSEAQGVPLKLVGTGAMPTLDFWNVENTFREHLIVKNLDEYKVHLPAPHCVFAEETVTLHFFCVTVNTTYSGAVDLCNNGVVPSAITMKLIYQANTNQDIFSLDKYECCVEPFMHKKININFSPKSLQEYRAVLEIRLKTLKDQQNVFKLCIIGEGEIPRIRMISPAIRQNKLAVLHYPLTCLGSVSNKVIRFQNISAVMCAVKVEIIQQMSDKRPLFWMAGDETTECMLVEIDSFKTNLKLVMKPDEVAKLRVTFNPLKKGRTSCDVKIIIVDNPYEYYTVLCEAEAFMEDVILLGLDMLSMDLDGAYKSSVSGTPTSGSTSKRATTKSAPVDKKKKGKRSSQASVKHNESTFSEPSVLKYIVDFGGCELCTIQKRSVIMSNNSEKVYKFTWSESDYVLIKPSVGYISPGEEKDLEFTFFSATPVGINMENLNCLMIAISDDSLAMDIKGVTWDNRQTVTLFEQNKEVDINERLEKQLDEQTLIPSDDMLGIINMIVLYSATTEYTKYKCNLPEDMVLKDTFIYKTRSFSFNMENIGNVPMKITWAFNIDDEYPARTDKETNSDVPRNPPVSEDTETDHANVTTKTDGSKETLFSGGASRDSVDTWFEVDLPFKIEPAKVCLKPKEKCIFNVTFSPLEAFEFKVRLTSSIDNLDPYDQNACCKMVAKSMIPYVHLDIEETDYITDRRKSTGVTLPHHLTVLEFNVLGSGCFKKEFSVINPTSEGYEFTFEQPESDMPELVPMHCNMLKGYVEGGTSTEVTFTFSPSAPGIYESLWKFIVNAYNLVMPLMVVGIVREPDVMFDPTILIITNSLVGFTTKHEVKLRNNENQSLNFEFKGNSLINETGRTPIVLTPEKGVLKACSDTTISISYTPITDGATSFKIFCNVAHLVKQLILCVTALSHSINPTVTYTLIGNKHVLKSDVFTNIHFDQTASTYERKLVFTIRNDGSATFLFDWRYNNCAVKKYLDVRMEPRSGHVTPANELECTLYFTLRQVPVHAFPMKLLISDGPEYNILLNADIMKPMYRFSCKVIDFDKCLVLAPESTYKKSVSFYNEENYPVMLNLNFTSLPELYVDFEIEHEVKPKKKVKIPLYFRPKLVKQYEIQLPFSVQSLCAEVLTVRGEGVPLLIDLYEGCQRSFDLGAVRVGEKCIRQIEVMNHSKVPIDTTFVFQDSNDMKTKEKELGLPGDNASDVTSLCLNPTNINVPPDAAPSRVDEMKSYREEGNKRQLETDTKNALASLRVVPSRCTIKPHEKVPLKIHFKPVDMISFLNVQLNAKVLRFLRPLVLLSGSATVMKLALSQNSIQFGRVRKRGCRVMKVMLKNEGDFNTRFCWQPLVADEFTIAPMQGNIDARTNITFTVTFRPKKENPFIKVWACCNVDNHRPLELAIHATCIDTGIMQCRNMFMECPVREVSTDYISIQNPTDDSWYILSEISGGPFETLSEFTVEPNQTFNVPLHFKPKKIGQYEAQVMYSPLGETALFLTVVANANHPNPNGKISITVSAKEMHTEILPIYNLTEEPEKYVVVTEVTKTIPDKFEGYYEFKHPETVRVWGEAKGSIHWSVICFQECEMEVKVMFINTKTREYQYYDIAIAVGPSHHVAHVSYVARARESCTQDIVIRNPLNEDITFHIECERLQVPETVQISANSSAELSMTYSPLVVGEVEETLMVSNPLIGTYTYKVTMRCIPAKEKDLELTTPLGTCVPLRLRAQNKTNKKADFMHTIYHPCIMADKESYSLPALEKGKFLFWYEPTDLGVQKCKVSIDSETAGEFIYNITGIGTEPKPQGPYEIKAGSFTTIVFKNVFEETRTFKIFVDREDFTWKIQPAAEPIKSKKDMKVLVYLNDKPGQAAPPTGCLTIECLDPPEPRVQWTYFLQGI